MNLPRLPNTALRVLHIGGYWRGPNDMVRQMMLGLRQVGLEVHEFDTDRNRGALDTDSRSYDRGTTGPVWLRYEAIEPLIAEKAPHLIVCNAGGLSFRPADAARLREKCCLLGIALSDPDVFEPTTRWIAPLFDRFLTLSGECIPSYRAIGAEPRLLRVATNDEYYRPVPSRPEMVCDVLMMGRAHADRIAPVRRLIAEFDTHVYGEAWEEAGIASRGFIYGEDLLAALNSATATLVFNRTMGGHRLVKVQIFDFLAAGALVLTNEDKELRGYFDAGRELAVFSSERELVSLVGRAVSDPAWARSLRDAGRARVLAQHTWKRVWPSVLAELRGGGELVRRAGRWLRQLTGSLGAART